MHAMLTRFTHVQLLATLLTIAHQACCPWDSPGKNTGVGCLFPFPGDLPDPGIQPASPVSLALQMDSLPWRHQGGRI